MRLALTTASGVVLLAVVTAGCSTTKTGAAPSDTPASPATTSTSASQPAPPGDCAFPPTPDEPAPPGRAFGPPSDEPLPRQVGAVLHTSGGEVPITLAGDRAPCTVRSFVHLGTKGYFNGTGCHRLTLSEGLKVLQCGDPTGTGTGGPGYTVPDENPTDLPATPSGLSVYARGTVAMANTGQPNSGGSQFFMVFGDSTLPPTYAVFGTVDATGLATLDAIAAAGITPGNSAEDGAPRTPVTIEQVDVTG